ncbi:MAG: aminotransferase class III-fold pyridoxal phosphate-dependent enzyme [Spirochaetales bacterium]
MAKFTRKYALEPVAVAPVHTKYRHIVTKLPVPESLPLFERLEKFEPISMQGMPPVVIDRAEGIQVWDKWGNKWLDWSSGVLISNAGNAHPEVVKALKAVLDKPLLSTYVFPHEARADLSELLVGMAPAPGYKAFLLSTGSEATENCIKLAKTWGLETSGPDRNVIVTFQNAFHGRTMGAQLAGGMQGAKRWIGKLDETFVQVPFPDGYKNPDTRFELFTETLAAKGLRPEQVCAVMTESFQGVGPDFLPVEYAQALEAWCRKHGVLLICDEVQSGFCRSGKWFAYEHYGITPDLIAMGKGISSSLALAAVLGRADVMDTYAPGTMTSTHSGSPLPVASALASIRVLREGDYAAKAAAMDVTLRQGLEAIARRHPTQAGCVHSRGLVAGIQMVKPGTKTPDPATALAINVACFQRGLLMFAPVGIGGECIKIAPPLDMPLEALEEGLAVLGEAMDAVLGHA